MQISSHPLDPGRVVWDEKRSAILTVGVPGRLNSGNDMISMGGVYQRSVTMGGERTSNPADLSIPVINM